MTSTYAACAACGSVNRIAVAKAAEKPPVCGKCHQPIAYDRGVIAVSGAAFANLVKSSPLPVVVDFWAPWCGPCRSFAPIFTAIAGEQLGRAVFVKLDTEADPATAQAYGIRGIPTVAVFKDGREVTRQSGALPATMLRQLVESAATP